MPVVQYGNKGLTRQSNETLKMFSDGTVEAVVSYKCPFDKRVQFIPKPGQEHPDFPSLKLFEFGGDREEGNIWRYDCIFKGVYAGIDLWPLMQEEVTVNTSQEPVETFWKFSFPWDNPPVTPADLAAIQAALDANLGTPPSGFLVNTPRYELWRLRRRGIDSYRMMTINARLSYVVPTSTPPTADFILRVGTTDSNTTAMSKATTVPKPGTRDYLFNGVSWRKAGGAISITEEHALSGPNKWNPYLYQKNTQ